MLAFSIWNAIWLVIVSFLFISVLMMLFYVVIDLFRDHELNGWAKAAWIIGLIFFPLLGLLIYVIARGKGMTERRMQEQVAAKESFDSYVRDVSGGTASQLEAAGKLHDSGKLSDEEFATLKAKLLA